MKKVIVRILSILAFVLPLGVRANFTDNCTTFDTSLWNVASWAMGRGSMQSTNIAPSGGGVLNFKVPANTYDGGEIYSKTPYAYGQASASFKCANVQGVISSIYLYQGAGSSSDEIDIEIYKNSGGTWEIAFTIYKAGVINYQTHYYPSFDPSAGYNTYLIDWTSSAVKLSVNGMVQGQFTTSGQLPTHNMNIQLIAWWPTWLTAVKSSSDKFMQVNWISYVAH